MSWQMAALCLLAMGTGPESSLAQTPVESSRAQSAHDTIAAAVPPESTDDIDLTASYKAKAAHIRELMAGALDPAIAPDSLFDIPLTNTALLALEAARLEQLLGPAEATAKPPAGIDSAIWSARSELDRARLAFYRLPAEHAS